ncbi:Hypothetical Protein sle_03910 [Streptomyces leeuwenhoekii]|uniref:Uncharacterized protein n=1 Tax=Streptomyces leeuwenhoekii TaxID=1437453 RepID=A0A0F7VNL6_STRLW|nr:Hypothetical Protein sle_03910 [Streptomyces leeuwenhoekii]
MVDVWLWRLRAYFLHIVLDEGLPVWFNSVSEQEAATHLGGPHSRVHQWWQAPDLSVSGLHHPPRALDESERVTMPLAALDLGPGGAVLPEDLQARLHESQREARKEAHSYGPRFTCPASLRFSLRMRESPPRSGW